jgi:hypothetical protein
MKSKSYDVLSKHLLHEWRDDPDNINIENAEPSIIGGAPDIKTYHRKSICGKNMQTCSQI